MQLLLVLAALLFCGLELLSQRSDLVLKLLLIAGRILLRLLELLKQQTNLTRSRGGQYAFTRVSLK